MTDVDWILIESETADSASTIFVVEIAAQRMRGWERVGEPFWRLLNHNGEISSDASRIARYPSEILERDGEPPKQVYAALRDYADDRFVVSYDLRHHWDHVLIPEWRKLGIAPIGQRGFCALHLTERLLDPVPAGACKLQTVRQYYRLPERETHSALATWIRWQTFSLWC